MPGIQDWIHKLEVGEGVRYVKVTAMVLAYMVLAAIFDLRGYKAFSTQEAMDAAQLARNIADGKGYTTDFIRPISIHLLQKRRGEGVTVLREPHPDLANPPVYPVVLAGLMKALPFHHGIPRSSTFWWHQPEIVIAIFNQLLFFAGVFLIFKIAQRLFDASVAWVSAVVMAGTNLFWRFSVSGLSTMLLLVILLGLIWCLVALEGAQRELEEGETLAESLEEDGDRVAPAGVRKPAWFLGVAVLAGVLLGLGGLTRYSFLWLTLPVLGFLLLFMGARRIQSSALVLTVALLIVTPWLVRNHQLSGNLFGTAGYATVQATNPFRGNRLERFLTNEFEQELGRVDSDVIFRKLMLNTAQIVEKDLPSFAGNWTSAFFLAGLLIPFQGRGLNRIRYFLLVSLGVFVLVQAMGKTYLSDEAPIVNSENMLVLLAPMVFVFGVAMYFTLLDQIDLPIPQLRTAITSFFCLLVCLPLVFAMLPPRRHPFAYPPYWPPGIQDVSHWMGESELMMSDMPWAVAWYGDRQCVWTTLSAPEGDKVTGKSDFFAINDFQRPINGLYLTTITTDARFYSEMLRDKDYDWGRFMVESMLRTNVPAGFPLKQAPDNMLRYGLLFLSDRVRWEESSR